ncbi:peptidoglycan DD-metalloendopeptidase family protein [Carboxylicivirga marina]|uniref:Peptidoglycan DD-metalloendopeptidase family protein n=1 Tax=Carboxylicivirga marina TaxID=2800988 RepID=A0ABS1HHA3_9BACT|nr:peptidoglycan DD-metalloendopeptidase family protein [Carboxylicivirga marina]MBK3517059.1 peptidoglycan DD-metalloendopeptidase family protein [Carboxylicivirga marina]
MEEVGLYLLKSSVVSGIFFLIYYLLLQKESFFKLSRFYLLASLSFSYIFPFIRINITNSTVEPLPIIETLQSTVNQFSFIEEQSIPTTVVQEPSLIEHYWWLVFPILLSSVFLYRFLNNIIHLLKTIHANEKVNQNKFTLVLFNQPHAFSFFRYIFISPKVWRSPKGHSIITHELSHLKHKHSLDRLLLEILLIIFWMNPFIYLYRKALEEVHEFQADSDATQNTSIKEYFNLVLQQSSAHNYSPLMSPFSYKLIKKRIKMAKYKSNPLIKLVLIIPIIIGVAIVSTSAIKIKPLQFEMNEYALSDKVMTPNDSSNTNSTTFIIPINNYKRTASGWGYRIHPIHKTKRFHPGLDFTANMDTPVLASQSGKVSKISTDAGYGKRIEIQHFNEYKTVYAHLNSFNVAEGQSVNQGDVIAFVGNTGKTTAPHLHFEIYENGKNVNPNNFLNFKATKQRKKDNTIEFDSPIKKEDLTRISSGFGIRKHPITKKMKQHNGVDYVAPLNTKVLAIGDGTVRKVKHEFIDGKGHGRFVIVDHENGYSSLYSQLNAYKVKEGQKVKQGDIVGLLGSSGISTGSHLHLEIKKDGKFVDPATVIK